MSDLNTDAIERILDLYGEGIAYTGTQQEVDAREQLAALIEAANKYMNCVCEVYTDGDRLGNKKPQAAQSAERQGVDDENL